LGIFVPVLIYIDILTGKKGGKVDALKKSNTHNTTRKGS